MEHSFPPAAIDELMTIDIEDASLNELRLSDDSEIRISEERMYELMMRGEVEHILNYKQYDEIKMNDNSIKLLDAEYEQADAFIRDYSEHKNEIKMNDNSIKHLLDAEYAQADAFIREYREYKKHKAETDAI